MKTLIIIAILCLNFLSFAQEEYGLGTLLDPKLYANSPTAAPLMRGDFDGLPSSFSLKEFAPVPGHQGKTATCAGWAVGYAGRTLLEVMKRGLNRSEIDSNIFSPSYIYNQIRAANDCKSGTSLVDALELLKNQGGLKYKDFGFECEKQVSENDRKKALAYKIIEYRDITVGQDQSKIIFVKKSLSERNPVVIAFDCPPSFSHAKEIWYPDSTDYLKWGRGHAMTVIGYDNNKFGGAFEIMNSWGTRWGNGGFTWVRYSDFDYFCQYAFDMIDKSAHDPDAIDLSGSLNFRENNGSPMRMKMVENYLTTIKPYPSGTLFELKISNNEPAYVYSFSTDQTFKTYKIFPFNDRMVAYLPYKKNDIAIPDEENYNMLDEVKGKSYYCFFYSKEKLDINNLMSMFENEQGSVQERIFKILRNQVIDSKNIKFNLEDKISFTGKSKGKSVIPVIIEIPHI